MEGKVDIISAVQARFNKDFAPIQEPQTIGEYSSGERNVIDFSDTDSPKVVTEQSKSNKSVKFIGSGLTIEQWRELDPDNTSEVEAFLEEHRINLSRPIPKLEPILFFDGVPICHKRNISYITGGPGCRKTTLLTQMEIAYLKGASGLGDFKGVEEERKCVLHIDTEQNPEDYALIAQRVQRGLGLPDEGVDNPDYNIVGFSDLTGSEMVDMTTKLIKYYQPTFVAIDGIGDYAQAGVNDPAEAQKIIKDLGLLAKRYDTHIACILHTNPETTKERGHLGSEVQRKAETAIIAKIDSEQNPDVTMCSWKKTRRKRPCNFDFFYDNETQVFATHIQMSEPNASKNKNDAPRATGGNGKRISAKEERIRICSEIFADRDTIPRSELISLYADKRGIVPKSAQNDIPEMEKMGILTKDKNGCYRLTERNVI